MFAELFFEQDEQHSATGGGRWLCDVPLCRGKINGRSIGKDLPAKRLSCFLFVICVFVVPVFSFIIYPSIRS